MEVQAFRVRILLASPIWGGGLRTRISMALYWAEGELLTESPLEVSM